MTVFEQELQKLFEQGAEFSDIRFVGNTCYGRLDGDVRVKIRFVTGGVADHYDRLKVTLINRREGEIDRFHPICGMTMARLAGIFLNRPERTTASWRRR